MYGLGVVLYQLLTGVLPYPDTPPPVTALTRGAPRPPRELNPEVPGELEAICLKAMAADPASRYATASRLIQDLRAFIDPRKPGLLRRAADALKGLNRGTQPSSEPAPSGPPPEDRREDF